MAQVPTAFGLNTSPVAAQWSVTTHPATPLPATTGPSSAVDLELDTAPRISAVGAGEFGARAARLLSRNLLGVMCYEVTPSHSIEHENQIASLVSSLQHSDLVFILIKLDDPDCEAIAQAVGSASCNAGVLTIAISPQEEGTSLSRPVAGAGEWYDSLFAVSGRSLPPEHVPILQEGDTPTGYGMQQMVAAITTLITHQTCIGIDFRDIIALMQSGHVGRLGVGSATGGSRAVIAAKSAISRLEAQGLSLTGATGVLATVHGSSTLAMGDFDDACRVVHECVPEDADLLFGMISDEALGESVKVTVMAVQ